MDLVGLGWRPEIAPFILSHLDQIDLVEVMLDDYINASTLKKRSLKTLAAQTPIIFHGVGLGLASTERISSQRLKKIANLFEFVGVNAWSEHLAFVRAGKIEIGHLAAPPRSAATIQGALDNIKLIEQIVGTKPALENIATLIDPPCSTLSEPNWTKEIIYQSDCGLLLDLHNLYSNAVNFGFDPLSYMMSFPLEKVQSVHLSGGKWIPEPKNYSVSSEAFRLLDDHVHDIPEAVYELLGRLAEFVTQPLQVIIERDGEYPEFSILLEQIARTKSILQKARNKKTNSEVAYAIQQY